MRFSSKEFVWFFSLGRVKLGVAKKCAEHLTPCVLELGGKNPVLVTEDCADVVSRKAMYGEGC